MSIEYVAGGTLAAVLLLVFLLRRYAGLPGWPLMLLVVALLLGLLRLWSSGSTGNDPCQLVRSARVAPDGAKKT
ncbi:MAG: hypothetical protein ACXVHC_08455, partial [Frankiaceae bacterium]